MIRLFRVFNKALVVIAIFIFLAFGSRLALAAWWDVGIPVPGNTQELKKENKEVFDSKFEFTHYSSTLSPEIIRDFYSKKLASMGWKEVKMQEELRDSVGDQAAKYMDEFFSYNLMFEKGNEELIVTIIPGSTEGNTRFSVSRGKVTEEAPPAPKKVLKPVTPQQVIPIYPGSTLDKLNQRRPGAFSARYYTVDDKDKVISFYKEKMVNLGWDLDEEKPFAKEYECAACTKQENAQKARSLSGVTLDFMNDNEDSCKIIVTEGFTAKAKAEEKTIIMVTYYAGEGE